MKSFYSEAKQHLSNCLPTSSTTNDKHELEHEYNYDDCAEHDHDAMTRRESTQNDRRESQTTSNVIGLNNNNFITNTTTYDTLQKPFKYDKLRGRWSTAADFYFASTSHAFGTIVFSELTLFVSLFLGGKLYVCIGI